MQLYKLGKTQVPELVLSGQKRRACVIFSQRELNQKITCAGLFWTCCATCSTVELLSRCPQPRLPYATTAMPAVLQYWRTSRFWYCGCTSICAAH